MQKYYDTVLGSDGSPLVGAQVTVYLTGTTTKATIYTDNGVTQAPNPLTTDSRGMFAFYAADGRYDIKAEKSGFGTLTMSDIQVNEQDTASTIAFTPAGGISANTVSGALLELDNEIAAHLAAADPHPGYLTPAEGDAAYAALGHVHNATAIVFTPTGNIAATTVAAALAELDTEKAALSGATFTGDVLFNTKVGVSSASPYAHLDVGKTGANNLNALFTTGVDDLNFRAGFMNGVAGSSGTSMAKLGLFYLGSGECATIDFIRGASATDGSIAFRSSGNEKARIDASGNLIVGSASQISNALFGVKQATGTSNVSALWNAATTGNNGFITFGTEGSFTERGYIYYNRGAGQTQLSATSDERLKENIIDAPSTLEVINRIRVRQFDWKETGNTNIGFIAQELYSVIPEAACVGEDNPDGSIKRHWGVSKEFLVPYLVKAVQELAARVAALEAE